MSLNQLLNTRDKRKLYDYMLACIHRYDLMHTYMVAELYDRVGHVNTNDLFAISTINLFIRTVPFASKHLNVIFNGCLTQLDTRVALNFAKLFFNATVFTSEEIHGRVHHTLSMVTDSFQYEEIKLSLRNSADYVKLEKEML